MDEAPSPNILDQMCPFPEKASFLWYPSRYKVLYGGRGGSKSWDFARALLMLGIYRKLFIVCGREIQKSIKESVHKLLADQILELGFSSAYEVKEREIVGNNGTRFTFVGVRNNVAAIKSMEAIDIFAMFEATFVSKSSWDIVLPTVRRDPPGGPFGLGSEIWIEFNPELVTDETYQRWVVNPPPETVAVEINWRDNPWFPEVLHQQKEALKKSDYESYLTVWEGKTRQTVAGAIYEKEMAAAKLDGRISPFIKVNRAKPVHLSFDLGRADMTSIWFWQQIGTQHHAVDFYENCNYGIDHYLEAIQSRRYVIGQIYLPHDAAHHHQSAQKSILTQIREAFPGDGRVKVSDPINPVTGINAVRQLFSRVSFSEDKCDVGLNALGHYRFKVDPDTGQRSKEPLHDWASHAADAFECYAMGLREESKETKAPPLLPPRIRPDHPQAWMYR
jgi:phage terminase large subunit